MSDEKLMLRVDREGEARNPDSLLRSLQAICAALVGVAQCLTQRHQRILYFWGDFRVNHRSVIRQDVFVVVLAVVGLGSFTPGVSFQLHIISQIVTVSAS